jgi:peptide-methionine (S)-S-oxide reductase
MLTRLLFATTLLAAPMAAQADEATAVFAGGCFWCVESDFDKVEGVLETVSGYTGGTTTEPTYKDVTRGGTGHYEAVEITYDPDVVDFETLVRHFFTHVDPTDDGGQFCDRGHSYKTAIFAQTEEQRTIAAEVKAEFDAAGILPAPIVTPILDGAPFWDAEGYHQDYYMKNPIRYTFYRRSCGRDARVDALWGDYTS